MSRYAVNVVIPTFQRHMPLQRTLAALASQTVRDFAVTVIDDANPVPVEPTIPAALRTQLDLRFVRFETNRGPAAGRNAGVRAVDSEYIAFVDDDVVPEQTWLDALLSRARDHGSRTVVIGPLVEPHDWKPTPWNRWEASTLARQYARIERGEYLPTWRQFFTGNALLARRDFEGVGGFNEHFTRAEDIELGYRLHRSGCSFAFAPDAVGLHYAERSKAAWMALPRRYARSDRAMHELYPELHLLRIIQSEKRERTALTRWGRTMLRGPARTAAVHGAVETARVTHALGLSGVSTRLLSLAYDLSYHHELSICTGDEFAGSPPPSPGGATEHGG